MFFLLFHVFSASESSHSCYLLGPGLARTEQHKPSAARQLLSTLLITGTVAKPLHPLRRPPWVRTFPLT